LFGRSVTFTATVAVTAPGAAATTGTVTFFDGTTALATVAVSGSTASFTTAGLAPGAHAVTARYSGTAGLAGSTSAARTVTVGFSSPCITTASSKALTVESGQAACVGAGGTVKSSVTVKQGGSLYVSGGSITGSVTTTGATAVTICKATVGGSISVFGSTGFVLIGDGTSACGANTLKSYLTAASNTGGIEVAGNTFSGPVTLTNNSGSGPLPGQRIPIVRANTITGNLSCTGNVPGVDDVGNKASSYSGQCTLTGTSVSVAASPSGGTVATGQPVTFTATLAFTGSTVPTGTVSFTDGGAPLAGCASVPVSARTAGSTTVYSAACTVTWTDSGYHSVTAAYSGDTRLAPSVSAVPVAVTVA
ncbi:MAG TPA: Ig-like domain-containing protein, partial [Acidimicrobiales bacterium]|nr:Ig-like domain-containing protein [Acidimicrobiales bacterium]